MMVLLFSTQSAAQEFSDAIDAAMGYPSHGVHSGGQVHADCACDGELNLECPMVTLRYAAVMQTQGGWSYPCDAAILSSGVPLPSQPVEI